MKQKVIAIFDIGKTNKKFSLFDENLNLFMKMKSYLIRLKMMMDTNVTILLQLKIGCLIVLKIF